jgi:ABC-type transport system involved in multi-copper enzyme maturation permease subunit
VTPVPPDGVARRAQAQVPSAASAVWALARITLTRLLRGKAVWIGVAIAALPPVYALIERRRWGASKLDSLFEIFLLTLALIPALFVASSIGEELEDRTSTYLWSRPIPRWAVLVGKLCALAPIAIALLLGGWCATGWLATQALPPAPSCLAIAAGGLACSLVAAGIAVVVPKHGMAMAIGYLLFDTGVGIMPFSIDKLSLTYQTRVLAGLGDDPPVLGAPLLALAVIAGVWSAIGLWRISRLEA